MPPILIHNFQHTRATIGHIQASLMDTTTFIIKQLMKKQPLISKTTTGKLCNFGAIIRTRMKLTVPKTLFFSAVLGLSALVQAQQNPIIRLKSGNILTGHQSVVPTLENRSGYTTCFVTFSAMPDNGQKQALAKTGITLLEYVPELTWYSEIPTAMSGKDIAAYGILSVHK